MARNTTNLSLRVWDDLMDSFNHEELEANWDKIDAHDHTGGPKGLKIPLGGLAAGAVDNPAIADEAVSTAKIAPAAVTTTKISNGTISRTKMDSTFSPASSLSTSTTVTRSNDTWTNDLSVTFNSNGVGRPTVMLFNARINGGLGEAQMRFTVDGVVVGQTQAIKQNSASVIAHLANNHMTSALAAGERTITVQIRNGLNDGSAAVFVNRSLAIFEV